MTKMILIEEAVVKQALEALEPFSTPHWAGTGVDKANEAITSLRAAIASYSTAIEQMEKQEPAPVQGGYKLVPVELTLAMKQAWVRSLTPSDAWSAMLAAAPAAQRQSAPDPKDRRSAWVELTDEELEHLFDTNVGDPHPRYPITLMDWVNFARAIEAKLKAKNSP